MFINQNLVAPNYHVGWETQFAAPTDFPFIKRGQFMHTPSSESLPPVTHSPIRFISYPMYIPCISHVYPIPTQLKQEISAALPRWPRLRRLRRQRRQFDARLAHHRRRRLRRLRWLFRRIWRDRPGKFIAFGSLIVIWVWVKIRYPN